MKPVTAAPWRLFAALELPAEWQTYLARLIDSLKNEVTSEAVRWARPAGIHLTLKFYGEVRADMAPALEAALRQAAAGYAPLALTLAGLGVFPALRAPRVVWVGVTGDLTPLMELQRAVETGAAALGFAPEARGFAPHLTLGRIGGRLSPADSQTLQRALAAPLSGGPAPAAFTGLSLMRSELRGPGGARYTCLAQIDFGGRAA